MGNVGADVSVTAGNDFGEYSAVIGYYEGQSVQFP
ncbi:Uncharacterised protein [Segatella copri]|nr:Uncharacterised protein [Segatella copri]